MIHAARRLVQMCPKKQDGCTDAAVTGASLYIIAILHICQGIGVPGETVHVRHIGWIFLLAATGWAQAWAQIRPPSDRLTPQGLQLAPALEQHAPVQEDLISAFLSGETMAATGEGHTVLTGDAQVRRIDAVVKGDRIEYDHNTGDVHVRGHGFMMRDVSIVQGPEVHYNLRQETGTVVEPEFWLGSGASGKARQADVLDQSRLRLYDAVYSACPCPDPAWFIEASRVDLDLDANTGVARNSVLYFKGVPILATPYFQFPLRRERKSGFLTPVYGLSTKSGFEFALPYYMNLAPNYDATLTPRYLDKRGLQLGGEVRYLGRRYSGQLDGTYLVSDQQRDMKRWMATIQHEQRLGGGFNTSFKLHRVSDDDYYRDFSTLGLGETTDTHLSSSAALRWSGYRYFSASLQVQTYQSLQDRDLSGPITPPYSKLPELRLRAARHDWGGLDVISENIFTRFHLSPYHGTVYSGWNPSWQGRRLRPNGTRLTSYNSLAWPVTRAGWYVTPKLVVHASHYRTDWYADALPAYAGRARAQSRIVPLMSLDAGMTFERNTSLFGRLAVQTLEPRVYYLRVPYREQDELPVYDTGLASFNFAQAFDENIYTGGWDRIAEANQLTVGATTRWLDGDTGFERVSLSAAQRLHFDDPRVLLYTGKSPRTTRKSDYLVGANAVLTDHFSVRFGAQFSPQTRDRNKMTAGIRWEPKRLTSVFLSYRYDRDPELIRDPSIILAPGADRTRESIVLSTQWPLTAKMYALGRFDYSLTEKRNTQSILGFEYKGDCCWVARVVAQRYAVSVREVNTALFFQLELSGLGSLGTDPMELLRERIAGYQPVTHASPDVTPFERYE